MFNNYLYFIQKEMVKYCCTFVHPVSFDKHRDTKGLRLCYMNIICRDYNYSVEG